MMETILLTAGVGLLGLVGLEGLARWWRRRRGVHYVWTPYQRIHMTLDPEAFPGWDPDVWAYCNSDGEHGPEAPKGCYRVLTAGGSSSESYFLDQDLNFPAVLHQRLQDPKYGEFFGGRPVHVANIARSLAPCESLHRMMTGTFDRYDHLDLVIVMVGGSDVLTWLERGAPPVYEDDRIPIDRIFAITPETQGRWALRGYAAGLHRRLRRPIERRTRVGKRLVRLRKLRANAKKIITEVPDKAPLFEYFDRHFDTLLRVAKEKAERVIYVRQPWFDVEPNAEDAKLMWNFGRGTVGDEGVDTYFSLEVVRELMRATDERGVAIAARHGVETVEVLSRFASSAENYYDFLHYTPLGAARLGAILEEAVVGRPGDPVDLERFRPFVKESAVTRS